MTIQLLPAGADPAYMTYPRDDIAGRYDTAAWQTAGLSFWFDPAYALAVPVNGVFEVADRRAGSALSIYQPNGQAPAMRKSTKTNFVGGQHNVVADALQGLGAAGGGDAAKYAYMDTSAGVLPTAHTYDPFEMYWTIHPHSAVCDIGGDAKNQASGDGCHVRLVNGQIRWNIAFTASPPIDTGLGAALVNRSMIVNLGRKTETLAGVPTAGVPHLNVLIQGETSWRRYTHTAAVLAFCNSKFRVGKQYSGYAGGSYNPYARYGTCMAFNLDPGATIAGQVEQYLAVKAGML